LTENRVLKGKAWLVILVGFNRLDQVAVNPAQRIDLLRVLDGGQLKTAKRRVISVRRSWCDPPAILLALDRRRRLRSVSRFSAEAGINVENSNVADCQRSNPEALPRRPR
jgi:hypothetical protein